MTEPTVVDTPGPRYTLRWACPRCLRAWIYLHQLLPPLRIAARVSLSAEPPLRCGRCGSHWEPWETGIDWQPENDAARDQIQAHP